MPVTGKSKHSKKHGLSQVTCNSVKPFSKKFNHSSVPVETTYDLQAYVRGMRQKTMAHLEESGTFWGEVKQGQGSIRDVEFTAQFLQLVHGKYLPEIRTPNTVEALKSPFQVGIIQPDEYRILMEGYVFQRTIEHFLQLLDYRQIHQIPADPHR